jgi:hypothetical protein
METASDDQFMVVPRDISDQLRDYIFRLDNLMPQIEQGDIEQLKNAHP